MALWWWCAGHRLISPRNSLLQYDLFVSEGIPAELFFDFSKTICMACTFFFLHLRKLLIHSRQSASRWDELVPSKYHPLHKQVIYALIFNLPHCVVLNSVMALCWRFHAYLNTLELVDIRCNLILHLIVYVWVFQIGWLPFWLYLRLILVMFNFFHYGPARNWSSFYFLYSIRQY